MDTLPPRCDLRFFCNLNGFGAPIEAVGKSPASPTISATWFFDNGEDVVIALVLGWDDSHWFVQDIEGAWKVPRAAWLPRARFARGL
jgi:hypothetical protein